MCINILLEVKHLKITLFSYSDIAVFIIYGLLFLQEFYRIDDTLNITPISISVVLLIFSLGRKLWVKILPSIFLLICSIIFSALVNANNTSAGGLHTLIYVIALLASLSFYSDRDCFRKISLIIKFLVIFTGTISLYMYFAGKQEYTFCLTGPFGNPNRAGMYFLSLMLLLINWGRGNISFFVVFCFVLILFTLARSSLLSAFVIIILTYFKNNKKIIFTTALIIFLVYIFFFKNNALGELLLHKFIEAGSTHRTELWTEVLNETFSNAKNILFGRGSNTIILYIKDIQVSVHNSYLNFFSDYGLISFMLLIYFLFKALLNISDESLLKSSIAILIVGLFETVLFGGISALWVTYILFYIYREENDKIHSVRYIEKTN